MPMVNSGAAEKRPSAALHQKILLLLLLVFVPAIASAIDLQTPVGGWRVNSCKDPEFVHEFGFYLAGDKSMDDVTCADNSIVGTLLPEGDVTDQVDENADDPALLIVNGNAMPLKTGGDFFSRPFSFGIGSNSIEIRKGSQKVRSQFYEASTTVTHPDIRIILSWDTDGTIVDLHVITPDGEHCWWGDRVLKNGGGLDVHTVEGYGPVIFATADAAPGLYGVYVNFWGNWSGDALEPTTATVDIILHESTVDEVRITKRVPLSRQGDLISLGSFKYEKK